MRIYDMLLDEILKIIPKKFDVEKHKRLYINAENMDRDQLKKIESTIIKGFRIAIVETLKHSGYKVNEKILKNVESLGPNPDILWIMFREGNDVIVIIGDSMFYTFSEKALEKFKGVFANYLIKKGVSIFNALFISLDRAESYILKRLFLTEMRISK
jgi:hypothetical protein